MRSLMQLRYLSLLALVLSTMTPVATALTFPALPGKTDSVSITEAAAAGTTVYSLVASSTSSWQILTALGTACSSATILTLSSASGVSTVNLIVGTAKLDYETNTLHVCYIQANDGLSTASSTITATITVSVINAWDVTPTPSATTVSGSVKEEQPVGTQVLDSSSALVSVTFTDAEIAGSGDVLTCSLSGTYSGYFTVTTAKVGSTYTCSITTRVKIDREALATDALSGIIISATDSGGLVGSSTMSVSVIDINDNAPSCTALSYTNSITESQTSGTMATIGTCTDADAGVNAQLVYAFVGSYTGFSLTGNVVSLTAAQDYDTMTINPVVIKVSIRDNAATASDQLTVTATVSVQVTAVNDNTPAFASLSPGNTVTIAESAALGTTLFTQTATDADKAGEPDSTLTWSILSAQSTTGTSTVLTNYFTIDSSIGTVKIGTQAMDYETWQVGEIVVQVSDNASPASARLSVSRTLTVSLTDVNEFPPAFTSSNYFTASVAENNVENYTVLSTFTYYDPDKSNLPVWCDIVSGNTDSVFRFNTTNRNVLELAKTVEPDRPTNHPLIFYLQVLCKDNNGTSPYKSSTATIEVKITTSNDYAPSISGSSSCTSGSPCSEATTLSGSTVGTFSVSDNDVGSDGVVDCRITGPASAPFVLQGCSSVLLSGSLDYETATSYALLIEAKDRGSPARSSTLTMNIYVGDVDDNAPYCTTYSYSFSVAENTATGTAINTIYCRDADSAGVTYTLVPATVPFTVSGSGSNAVLSVGSPSPDYESVTSYTFTVRTTDRGTLGRTTDATVIVQILAVNEYTPTFTTTTINVAENTAAGTVVTTFAAVDADTGGHGIVSYAIPAATSGGINFFSISSSGQVSLIKTLDYETTQSYQLTVTSRDGGGLVGTGTLTVAVTDVNDNSPICTNAQVTLTMAEDALSSTTATGTQPTATDADSPALYGKIAYSIASGNTGNYFSISSSSGTISRSGTAGLDYEALTPPYNYYNLTIYAIDANGAGPNTATCLAKVTVTDVEEGPPVFGTTLASATGITEASPVGTLVYSPTYTHIDKWDIPVFSILSSDGNFSIDSTNGKVYIAAALDYETATQHVLVLVATDKNGNKGSMTLTVPVGNINEFSPVCTPMSTTVYIDENDQTSPSFPVNVMSFSCSDKDAGTTLLYSVSKVNGTAGSTGYQFISNLLRTTAALNYEVAINAVLEIQISDQGPGTANILTVTVTVSVNPVNEYTPAITASTLTPSAVAENVAVGTSVAVLVATDSDQGSNHATIKYAIISGNSKGFFTVNEATGSVTTAKSLDYEDATSYRLTVSATDGPGLSSTATLTISLSDVNDNSPTFTFSTYSVSVDENAATGSVLLPFTGKVSDADGSSPNNAFTLALVTTGTPFQLVSNQLQLTAAGTLNAATNPSYTLVIRATDGASAPATLSTDAQVIVRVVAINSAAPSFSGSSTVSTAENTAVGSLISIANATDTDSGLNGAITYSIVTGNTNSDFSIAASTGYIRLNNALDFDAGTKVYYLGIEAKDSGSPAKSSTWTLTVSVTDVNDNAPIWAASNTYTLSVSEGVSSVPSNIYSTVVSDPDTGAGGTITYSVLSQTGTAPDGVSSLFAVDTIGAIRVVKQPDREFMSTYYVVIQACDGGSPSLCSQRLFTIYITDINDNTPKFGLCPKEIRVSEAATPSTIISTITATDADAGANAVIATYQLISADGGASNPNNFSVSSTGVISTFGGLDRETKSVYQLYITAEDSGSPTRLTGSCLLNITIDDVNDNAPVVSGLPIITSVSEGATGGTIFYTISATDADIGINAALLFDIIAFTPANNFSVNNQGQMYVFASNMLDRERNAAYNLTMRVRDQGTPAQTTTFTVSINILDINDNTPSFGATSIDRSVLENSAVGTAVGPAVGATDPDLGANASLTYQIAAILVPTSGGDYFSVDPLTGQIQVKVASLDRETRDIYILRLIAMDNGSPTALTGTTTVTISINDTNDNSPVFSSSYTSGVSVDENSATGTVVTTFTATDADIGANAAITYSIDASRLNGSLVNTYFQVSSSTGQLTVKTSIDRETYYLLQFYILAVDGGTTPNTASASVNLYINDVNDNTPVFNPTFYNTEMYYKETRTSITLATLKATDADATGNTISYGWGSTSSNFVVNTVTGAVTPAYGQATSKNSKYIQYPTATDSGSPQRTATATIRIDTFDPTEVAVCITYTLSETNFLAYQSTIESALTTTLQFKYPTNKCKTWKYTVSSSTQLVACHYCVQDNTTDSVSNIANAKSFVSQSDLLTFWRLDTAGTPTAMLQSSSFTNTPITKVEGYTDSTSTSSTVWYQTPWGIAIIVLSSVLAASLIGVGIGALANYLANRSPQVPVTKSAPKATPRVNHPPAQPKARPNENKNVYRDRNIWRGTPDFGRSFQNSPGELQQTGISPGNTRVPTPVS